MTAEAYEGELEMYRGLVRALRAAVRPDDADIREVRRLLHNHASDDAAAREKSSRETAADATPELTDRQRRLLDSIRTRGGAWTTARVLELYALVAPGVVQRGTARRDLAALHRAGHLVLVDEPNRRHYVLKTRKDDA